MVNSRSSARPSASFRLLKQKTILQNFRGPEILDTRDKVEKWMNNLCTEVSERLSKDLQENDRVAKSLTVSISQDPGGGQLTRCGPLFSYEPDKMARQAMQLIAKANQNSDGVSWKPKLKNLAVSASKFSANSAGADGQNANIQDFFKTQDKDDSSATTTGKNYRVF